MALKIIWSPLAHEKRKIILDFWVTHNQSNTYSIKLNRLFKEALYLVATYPHIGRRTDLQNVRIKIVRDYQIFYQIETNSIKVLTIWNSKQDSDKLIIR